MIETVILVGIVSLAGFKNARDNDYDVEADAWVLLAILCVIAAIHLAQ